MSDRPIPADVVLPPLCRSCGRAFVAQLPPHPLGTPSVLRGGMRGPEGAPEPRRWALVCDACEASGFPLCPGCVGCIGGACAGPDAPWRPARAGEACGAADHVDGSTVVGLDRGLPPPPEVLRGPGRVTAPEGFTWAAARSDDE